MTEDFRKMHAVDPLFAFFPLKRVDAHQDLADLEHMVFYGIEELLDLGQRGLYYDPVLEAREIRGCQRGGEEPPDLDGVRYHVSGSLTYDGEKDTVKVRLSVKDTQEGGRAQQRQMTLGRGTAGGPPAFAMEQIHEAHQRFYRWLADLAGLGAPEAKSYHAYRLEQPITTAPAAFRETVRGLRVAHEIDQKIAHYEQAVALDPCLGRAHRNLGYLHRVHGDLEEAIVAYQRAASTMIDRAGLGEVYFELGLSHAGQGDYRDAIRTWRRSLDFSPFRREALYNIGLAYEELGNNERAVDYYADARRADPTYLSALEGLFRLHIQEGAYLEAVNVLKDWIKITPHDAGLHRIIGHCYRKEGMNDEALVHLKKAVELDPEGEIGREARRDILDL